jgi:hypothetical protein
MHRSEFAAAFGTDTRLHGNSEKQVVDAEASADSTAARCRATTVAARLRRSTELCIARRSPISLSRKCYGALRSSVWRPEHATEGLGSEPAADRFACEAAETIIARGARLRSAPGRSC